MLPIDRNDMGKETLHHSTVRVKIEQPFQIETNNSCVTRDEECVNMAMRKIAEMLNPEYRGVYRTG